MKNLILTVLVVGSITLYGQINPHAIGIRGAGGNIGYGGEISYQHGLSDNNRFELDLGWRGYRLNGQNYHVSALSGIYHWWWNITDGLNWYVGPGAQVGFYRNKSNAALDGISVGVLGQIGIEYDFNQHDVPILISLDTRPRFGFLAGNNGLGYGGAFSIRFTF